MSYGSVLAKMSEEAKQQREEALRKAKEQRDKTREAHYKKVDEELKVLADIKRYTVAALLAIAVGAFRTDDKVSFYFGLFVCFILLLLLSVLIIVRYHKIKEYHYE